MAHWLFETEPSEYSYADLTRDKRVVWEGVSNTTALSHVRADPVLASTELVRISWLSVMPLTTAHHARVLERAGARA